MIGPTCDHANQLWLLGPGRLLVALVAFHYKVSQLVRLCVFI
jgi:hypothetical protein